MTGTNRSTPRQARLPFLSGMLDSLISEGHLTVTDASGRTASFGNAESELQARIRLNDRSLSLKLLLNPSLALGESYIDGRLTIESGTVRDFLAIVTSNLGALDSHPLQRFLQGLAAILPSGRRNSRRRAKANVAHHYDLSASFYSLFLDADWQYSCAYFANGAETLEEAQAAKKRHLAAKLLVRPGARVLDIGCGWGGLALELARCAQAEVLGLTLSQEQLELARERADAAGLAESARFELRDYRDVSEQFDRVVSVGMFEHVGRPHFEEFFSIIARALQPDGIGLVHSIGRRSPPGGADPWISKYIFPGGYIPALSETLAAVERSGMWVTDIEVLRLHYADTLKHWYDRFQKNRDKAKALYDERFCRMWEFYLAACEMLFRNGDLMIFQLQLAHKKDAVPLTRAYMSDSDRSTRLPPPPSPTSNQRDRRQPEVATALGEGSALLSSSGASQLG